jgi:hypothetical protein
MDDHGFFLTWQAIHRQLAAMPHKLYLIRLIHHHTRKPFPGERLWTAAQLMQAATIRFLRVRNREGCDVYMQPLPIGVTWAGWRDSRIRSPSGAPPAVTLPGCRSCTPVLGWLAAPRGCCSRLLRSLRPHGWRRADEPTSSRLRPMPPRHPA